jgi:hypothetical protein
MINTWCLWNSRAFKFASLIMNTCCCCWTSPHAMRGNEIVKMASLIMNTCTFLCALLFKGKWPLAEFVELSLLYWQWKGSYFCAHKSNWENGISKSVWEQPRVALLILIGILLCYLQLQDKQKRVCKVYVVSVTLSAQLQHSFLWVWIDGASR